jgi:hypothetical protein
MHTVLGELQTYPNVHLLWCMLVTGHVLNTIGITM